MLSLPGAHASYAADYEKWKDSAGYGHNSPDNFDETRSFASKYTIVPTDAQEKKVRWSSSDENIATVDTMEKVTLHGKGTVTITGTLSNGTKSSYELTITSGTQPVMKEMTIVPQDVKNVIDIQWEDPQTFHQDDRRKIAESRNRLYSQMVERIIKRCWSLYAYHQREKKICRDDQSFL